MKQNRQPSPRKTAWRSAAARMTAFTRGGSSETGAAVQRARTSVWAPGAAPCSRPVRTRARWRGGHPTGAIHPGARVPGRYPPRATSAPTAGRRRVGRESNPTGMKAWTSPTDRSRSQDARTCESRSGRRERLHPQGWPASIISHLSRARHPPRHSFQSVSLIGSRGDAGSVEPVGESNRLFLLVNADGTDLLTLGVYSAGVHGSRLSVL